MNAHHTRLCSKSSAFSPPSHKRSETNNIENMSFDAVKNKAEHEVVQLRCTENRMLHTPIVIIENNKGTEESEHDLDMDLNMDVDLSVLVSPSSPRTTICPILLRRTEYHESSVQRPTPLLPPPLLSLPLSPPPLRQRQLQCDDKIRPVESYEMLLVRVPSFSSVSSDVTDDNHNVMNANTNTNGNTNTKPMVSPVKSSSVRDLSRLPLPKQIKLLPRRRR